MINKQETVSELRGLANKVEAFTFCRDEIVELLEELIEKVKSEYYQSNKE